MSKVCQTESDCIEAVHNYLYKTKGCWNDVFSNGYMDMDPIEFKIFSIGQFRKSEVFSKFFQSIK